MYRDGSIGRTTRVQLGANLENENEKKKVEFNRGKIKWTKGGLGKRLAL